MTELTPIDDDPLAAMLSLIAVLRNACPWDKKQTPETLIRYLIEESYELMEAVHAGDADRIADEMGDVLFQVLFMAFLYSQAGQFTLNDVIARNREKMIRRHPHVFGTVDAADAEAVKANWAKIKADEKTGAQGSVIDGVPGGLSPLHRAHMISEKVGRAGFDWDDLAGVIAKVREEWAELEAAVGDGDRAAVTLEFGDLLFTLTNVARFLDIHPETALAAAISKFETRYRHMERRLADQNINLTDLSDDEKNRAWDAAKKDTQ
ncbi:hypothetical protein JCM14469_21840 [Desulfatiferula olefinivorans]